MGMSSEEIKSTAQRVLMNTYSQFDPALVRGQGALVYDVEGNEYLDFVAGLAVTGLGHAHPRIVEVVSEQAARLIHVSNLYYTEPQVRLAEKLVENCFADRAFFCNSGAEANEAAIKLARKYSMDKYGPGRYKIITMENSFHGRTMATMSATAQTKIHKGFQPLVDGFAYVPLGDMAALEGALDDSACGVLIEPIQGEGGVNEPGADYLKQAARLCREKNVLLIFDEVQVGLGRTGALFAHQKLGLEPDIMTLAKALANGLPMGAALARDEVARAFGPGAHATTFGGGPLVSAAALAVIEILTSPGFLDGVAKVGDYFKSKLKDLAGRYDFIKEIRGQGLILGAELTFPGSGVVKEMMRRGFLINCTNDTVLRFLPPLIITEADVDRLLPVLEDVLTAEASAVEE